MYQQKETIMNTTYTTVINHKAKTITTYEITESVVEAIKNLTEILPKKTDKKPVYSLGFQRYSKLSRKAWNNAMRLMYKDGIHPDNFYNTIINKLQNMTDGEFKNFKSNLK